MKWKNEKEDFSGGSQNIFLVLAKKWRKGQDEGEYAKNLLTTPNMCRRSVDLFGGGCQKMHRISTIRPWNPKFEVHAPVVHTQAAMRKAHYTRLRCVQQMHVLQI